MLICILIYALLFNKISLLSQWYSHHRLQQSPAVEVDVGQRPLPLRRGTAVRRQQRVQCPAVELLITLHFSQYEALNKAKKRHSITEP